jgi:hypothetical protein
VVSIESTLEHGTRNLFYCIRWDCGSHSGFRCVWATKINALLLMLGWARCDFHKKRTGARSTELVFLHPVGSVGHVVHFGASGLRNIDALFS